MYDILITLITLIRLHSVLPVLKLPAFDVLTREEEGITYVFDIIRKKWLQLTPEEWVRQHVVHLLVDHLGYPRALFKVESGLQYNRQQKRTDLIVHDQEGKPYLLVECKAPDIKVTQKTIEQASMYNQTLKAPYVAVTNGLGLFCFVIDFENKKSEQLKQLPPPPAI
jgi:hypothetical protein